MSDIDSYRYRPTSLQAQALAAKKSWQDKYRLLIQWADELPPSDDIRSDENLIVGCESLAWLSCHILDNRVCEFKFDSESRIVKGLAALLLAEVNGKHAACIGAMSLDDVFVFCGLTKHLSPSRTNGLSALVDKVRFYGTVAP